MKKILFVLLFCFLNTVFSQERESKIISDLKIGTYQNKISSTESKDKKKKSATLDIFASEPHSNGLFNLCIDVFVNKRSKDNYDGMGISIGSDKLDMVFNNLVSAQKQFQSLLNRGEVPEGMKIPIGRQFPVHVYKWTSEQPNGPANRADNNNSESYGMSVEFVNSKNKQELWISSKTIKLNNKEIAIVFDSIDNLQEFIKLIDPKAVRQKVNNNFKLKGRK